MFFSCSARSLNTLGKDGISALHQGCIQGLVWGLILVDPSKAGGIQQEMVGLKVQLEKRCRNKRYTLSN